MQGVRQWWCVTIIIVSDDVNFLITWASQAASYGILAWPRQILALTHRPLPLMDRQTAFSQANALIVSCPSSTRLVDLNNSKNVFN